MKFKIKVKDSSEFDNLISSIKELHLYNGTQMTRWSSRNYIRSENDCEHQNIVTHITIYICEKYGIDYITYRDAIGLASIHDMVEYAEGGMGDIPHSVKVLYPNLKKTVEDHEERTIKEVPYIGDAWKRFSKSKLARLIVNFADQLDVLLYIDREFSLGNQDEDFKTIYKLAYERTTKIYDELMNELNGGLHV